jgi:hypothetical protein
MEIVVDCRCGNGFTLRDEPVSGRLRHPVSCPHCGQDTTDQANDFIGKVLRGEDPFPQPKRSFFNLGRRPPARASNPNQVRQRRENGPEGAAPGSLAGPSPARITLGATVALGAGVVGALGWSWLALKTGFHLGFLALGIGALVGGLCRVMAPRGGNLVGAVAAAVTFFTVLMGHVLVTESEADQAIARGVDRAYQASLEDARRALKLQTDREVKDFLAARHGRAAQFGPDAMNPSSSDARLSVAREHELHTMNSVLSEVLRHGHGQAAGRAPAGDPNRFTEANVREFRELEIPNLRRLVDGHPSKEEWKKSLSQAAYDQLRFRDVVGASIDPYSIGWMIFGLITAFKLAGHKPEAEAA